MDEKSGVPFRVEHISTEGIMFEAFGLPAGWQAVGISLTPEVLVKCGFIDPAGNGLGYRVNLNSYEELCVYLPENILRHQTIGSGFTRQLQHIKYLHQLQNWWYINQDAELNYTP
jgi:hypothetical protein